VGIEARGKLEHVYLIMACYECAQSLKEVLIQGPDPALMGTGVGGGYLMWGGLDTPGLVTMVTQVSEEVGVVSSYRTTLCTFREIAGNCPIVIEVKTDKDR